MGRFNVLVLSYILVSSSFVLCHDVELYDYLNRTQPATRQLYEFALEHPDPVGILTTDSGKIVDIRETNALNTDPFFNLYNVDLTTHANAERIPERFVHAKGGGAFGYFEVTNDVSLYTKADVFNGVGKRTPLVARFSSVVQNNGGVDTSREMKGLAVKFYTQEGNLDFLGIQFPVYFYKNPNDFPVFAHVFKRNPKTNLIDNSMRWDFITKRPDVMHGVMWLLSDYGIPNGYRKMDQFPIHTYEIYNKQGDKYFVRFNFRSEQGLQCLPTYEAVSIAATDPDYYNRDLYNAIENGDYPAWRLEIDVMTVEDVKLADFDPFDITRTWNKGSYHTVPIGRLVLDRNPDNYFRAIEMSAFNPGHLVPGILGPIDIVYKTRISSYRDAQTYRLGVNHDNIDVNKPWNRKDYNRDGKPPVSDNMRDAPNYFPNSFSGPVPFLDVGRPKERFTVLQSNAVDLEPASYFYNYVLQTDEQRERLANNSIPLLVPISPELQRRALRLLTLTDVDLGRRVANLLEQAQRAPPRPPPRVIDIPRDNTMYDKILDNEYLKRHSANFY